VTQDKPWAVEDEAVIRTLIEQWVQGVQRQDIGAAVAQHTTDMLMFDVPPPVEVRGLVEYRNTWGPFFQYLKRGGIFELDRLDIAAGDCVAYATALLRCGTQEELRKHPDNRLRLTVGLRRENGRWMIAHEHHSFPLEQSD
jgi:ketosteroid isomerase-like protein